MSDTTSVEKSETSPESFYLPATVATPSIGRIEALVTERLSRHGIIPIPDTYGR